MKNFLINYHYNKGKIGSMQIKVEDEEVPNLEETFYDSCPIQA
jgi:hypothetical protein